MYITFIHLTLFVSLFGITAAFHCYQCSYDKLNNHGKEWNDVNCMTSPKELGRLNMYPCNDTVGFCTFTETYNLARGEVTSYYRLCSITFRGNKCTKDATNLVCVGSCRSDFCTKNDIGRQYETYFGGASSIFNISCYLCLYIFILICTYLS